MQKRAHSSVMRDLNEELACRTITTRIQFLLSVLNKEVLHG